ncbi:MAG: hypothetical protein JOZ83_09905 [Silvibacterium sp.]|nr:hypothetical protein [Silvibacterium sp.]
MPVVVLLRKEIATDLFRITAALVGAALGILAMLLFLLALERGQVDQVIHPGNPQAIRAFAGLFSDAAFIGGVAFPVYCSLVKRALRREAKQSGAPKGTPRSLPWFGI